MCLQIVGVERLEGSKGLTVFVRPESPSPGATSFPLREQATNTEACSHNPRLIHPTNNRVLQLGQSTTSSSTGVAFVISNENPHCGHRSVSRPATCSAGSAWRVIESNILLSLLSSTGEMGRPCAQRNAANSIRRTIGTIRNVESRPESEVE